MMADHGKPCTESDASYCMNGGKCFKIEMQKNAENPMSMLTCVCNNNFVGSRCEQFQLEIMSDNSHETGMIAAIVILLILILLVLTVVIYCICKVRRKAPIGKKDVSKSQNGAI